MKRRRYENAVGDNSVDENALGVERREQEDTALTRNVQSYDKDRWFKKSRREGRNAVGGKSVDENASKDESVMRTL